MSTFELNLNFPAKSLDGNDIENTNLGKILAEEMVQQSKGDSLKLYHWSVDLYAGRSINLDASDRETLRLHIKNSDRLFVVVKAQILEKLI